MSFHISELNAVPLHDDQNCTLHSSTVSFRSNCLSIFDLTTAENSSKTLPGLFGWSSFKNSTGSKSSVYYKFWTDIFPSLQIFHCTMINYYISLLCKHEILSRLRNETYSHLAPGRLKMLKPWGAVAVIIIRSLQSQVVANFHGKTRKSFFYQ